MCPVQVAGLVGRTELLSGLFFIAAFFAYRRSVLHHKGCSLLHLCVLCAYQCQGVVTYMSHVEAFATGIKTESSDQSPFRGPIKGKVTSELLKINNQERTAAM